MEKVGLGQDAEMFQNPPTAFIPHYMQAYASATQKRLIEQAKKATEEEATAAQPADQTPHETSETAEDGQAKQEVVATEDETEEGLIEQTTTTAEQTIDIDLD